MRGNSAELMEEPLTVRQRIFQEAYVGGREYGSATITPTDTHPRFNGYDKYKQLTTKEYSGKKILDTLIAGIGFVAFAIFYPFAWVGIKLSSKGPVIYKQKRTGQNGEAFICYKFRTMYCVEKRSQEGKPIITQKGDSRIFSFGKFLRMTNLDELPQIINVLKGEMSLIGPRPYPIDECAHWNNTFEDFFYRYSVKPGLSGYAQVNGFRGGTLDEDHMRKRLDKDLIYVQKQSFGFDLYIIWKTVLQMLHLNTNGH